MFEQADQFTRQRLRYLLVKARGFVLLAKPRGRGGLLGLAILLLRGQVARIYALGVEPSTRRRGIAALLLRASLKLAKRRGALHAHCDTRATNIASQRMVMKAGFEEYALVPHFYRDGEASLRYRIELTRTV